MAEKTGRELMQEYFDVVNGDDALLSIAYDLDILPEQILAHKKGLRELMTVVDFVQHERKEAEQRGQQTERERVLALVREHLDLNVANESDRLVDFVIAIQRGDKGAPQPSSERPEGVSEFIEVCGCPACLKGGMIFNYADGGYGKLRYRFEGIVKPDEKG